MAAFAACNQLDGITDFLDADADLSGMQVLDVRTPPEVQRLPFPGADHVDEHPARRTAQTAWANWTCRRRRRSRARPACERTSRRASCGRQGLNVHVVSGGTLVRSRAGGRGREREREWGRGKGRAGTLWH